VLVLNSLACALRVMEKIEPILYIHNTYIINFSDVLLLKALKDSARAYLSADQP
jgi:hypothetical protein